MFLRCWRILTGDTEFALRYLSVVGGVLMIALAYQAGRQLRLGRAISVIAALLIATSPYLLWYSQEAKMYTWLTSLALVAVYAYQRALSSPFTNSPFIWWAIFVVATSLSFYTHILAPLMLLVYALWATIQWPQFKTHGKGWLISMALLTLPYLPLLVWQAPFLFNGMSTGHPFYPLPEQTRLLLHFYSAGVLHSPYSLYLMAGATFLILLGLFAPSTSANLIKPHGVLPRAKLAAWLLIPPIAVYLVSLQVQIFEDRYLIYIAPAFYLLAALGLVVLMSRFRPLGWAILTLVVAFNLWGVYRQATNPIKADFRAAAAYIMTAESPPVAESAPLSPYRIYLPFVARSGPELPPVAVMIQMPYLQHTFDYYFDGDYRLLEGVWTNDDRPADEVDREMQTQLKEVETLWLVVSEEDYWDSRQLTRKWLDENAILQDEKHFVGVDVYKYELRMTEKRDE